MRGLFIGVLCLWLSFAVMSSPVFAVPPRSEFLQRATVSSVTLSPAGNRVAWLAEEGSRRALWLQMLDGSPARRTMAHTPANELAFTRDGRWLLMVGPTQVFALAMDGQRGSGIVTTLKPRDTWRVDSTQSAAITVVAALGSRAEKWQLKRITIGGVTEVLHEDDEKIIGFAFAENGQLRWLQQVENRTLVIRNSSTKRELLRCGELHRCTPIIEKNGALLLQTNVLSDDNLGLSRLVRITADGRTQMVARDPHGEADLDFLVADVAGNIRLAGYRSTKPMLLALEQEDRNALAFLQKTFPESALRPQLSETQWLIEERHSARAFARWYLFEPSTRRIRFFLNEHSGNNPQRLAKKPFTWLASDGMRLHGFITAPNGDPRKLPLVVLAHGGPWSHWQPQYNSMAQFIASRGAIVFEPNHRGSTGHGYRYFAAANGDYGNGRVQQDINDGARAMLAAGIGDADRVAIVGASFGGYAALQGVTFAPELYRAGVAFVPPVDFAWTLNWVLRNAESANLDGVVPMRDWLKMLRLDTDNAEQMASLRAQSPLANVNRLTRPITIVAGGSDERVGIAGIIEYAARASLAGKEIKVLIDHNAGHRQRNDVARETNLYLVETMLHQHLKLPKPQPPDASVKAYLVANEARQMQRAE